LATQGPFKRNERSGWIGTGDQVGVHMANRWVGLGLQASPGLFCRTWPRLCAGYAADAIGREPKLGHPLDAGPVLSSPPHGASRCGDPRGESRDLWITLDWKNRGSDRQERGTHGARPSTTKVGQSPSTATSLKIEGGARSSPCQSRRNALTSSREDCSRQPNGPSTPSKSQMSMDTTWA
jgi:hypothetical protein